MKTALLGSTAIALLIATTNPASANDSTRAPATFPTSFPHSYYSVQAQQATAANSLTGTLPGSQVTGQVNGGQIYGDINTTGSISAAGQVSGGYLWSAAGISTPGGIFSIRLDLVNKRSRHEW